MAVKYDKDTDYQALINDAVKSGNYKAAAQYEQQRNAKISDMNAASGGTNKYGATTTNKYSGWLDDTDYGTIGKQQMQSGASAEDVLKTYNSRYNKAANTEGLTQYANDDIQKEMWDYITANLNKPQMPAFDLSAYTGSKPTYTSKYDTRIDDMLNQILNRDKFSYDAATDPLFQQYQSMYQREGNRAMNDTLAAAAANAGGMNSYAITAAQQANDYYNAQLGDKIPELAQLAYSMYLDDIDLQVQDLGLLQNMDNTQYSRYRDTMSDWRDDRNFAYDMYRDQMGDWQWQKNFDYNAGRDQIADSRYDREWEYNVGRDQIADDRYNQEWEYGLSRDEIEDKRYESETSYNRALELINAGVMPDSTMLAQAGLSQRQAATMLAAVKAAQAAKTSSGSSSRSGSSKSSSSRSSKSSSSSGNGYTGGTSTSETVSENTSNNGYTETENNSSSDNKFWNSMNNLGLGPVSASMVEKIANYGGIIEHSDGTVEWAPGWNASNYKSKLEEAKKGNVSIPGFGVNLNPIRKY